MRHKICFILILTSLQLAAAPATVPVAIPTLLTQLQSPDFQQRQEAIVSLTKAYPKHAAEIEAAANHPGLDLQASIDLHQIIDTQKPRLAARQHQDKIVDDADKISLSAALDAYTKLGRHNPSWDTIAHDFLQSYFSHDSYEPPYDRQIRLDGLVDELSTAHCEDPLIVYYMARSHQQNPIADQRQCVRELKAAADALEASDYPANYKCFAHARYIKGVLDQQLWDSMKNWRQELGVELDKTLAEWPAAIQNPSLTDYLITDLADNLEYNWRLIKGNAKGTTYGNRAQLCDKLFPAWQQAHPKDPGPYDFKGALYVAYAWEGRGNGMSNTVTPDGWKKLADRLAIAREALETAYQLDPHDSRAPTELLSVEVGQQHRREQMEVWWKRAMDTDPDNYQACTTKLNYLEPKWYGSAADMISFGRECLSAANWEGRIPFILVDAHWTLSQYTPDSDAYFAQPDVWSDLASVYKPYLDRYPDAVWDRSHYAYYAVRCRQWPEAHRQFEILGNNPDLTPFNNSRPAYDYLRRKAELLSAPH